ncbi:hypothetical protein ACEV86_10410 [Vibrio parahaemolyticus]
MFRKNGSIFKSLFVALVLGASGCSTTGNIQETYDRPGWPGYISKSKSEFDGAYNVSMEPAYLGNASNMLRLGLKWNSSLPKDKYLLIAEWAEAENFSPDSPLGLNIDGSRLDLSPVDKRDYGVINDKAIESDGPFKLPMVLYNQTHKMFWISKNEVSRIIEAQKVVVRVELLNSYWEERLEPTPEALTVYNEYPYIWAKAGFAKFLSEQFSN